MIGKAKASELPSAYEIVCRFDTVSVVRDLHPEIEAIEGRSSSGVSAEQIQKIEIDGHPRYVVLTHNDQRDDNNEYRWHTIEDINHNTDEDSIRFYAGSRAPGIVSQVATVAERVENGSTDGVDR